MSGLHVLLEVRLDLRDRLLCMTKEVEGNLPGTILINKIVWLQLLQTWNLRVIFVKNMHVW
jgi:hypothetical protein